MITKIILLGKPVSTNVVYRRHGNIMYMSKDGKDLKSSYILQVKNQWKQSIITGDVEIEISLFFPDMRRRDIDNWHKLLLDSMTGICYYDDSQIIKMTTTKKIDKNNPRVEIIIL